MTTRDKPALDPRADAERVVDDELAFHGERTIEELTARGLDEADARAEAARRFGSHARYRKRLVGLEIRQQVRHRRRAAMEVFKQ